MHTYKQTIHTIVNCKCTKYAIHSLAPTKLNLVNNNKNELMNYWPSQEAA